jgi:hypothetical protein
MTIGDPFGLHTIIWLVAGLIGHIVSRGVEVERETNSVRPFALHFSNLSDFESCGLGLRSTSTPFSSLPSLYIVDTRVDNP